MPLTRRHMERYNLFRRLVVPEFREHEVSEENPKGMRLRLVDDLSESMVNFATGCSVAVRNDGIDFFRFVVLLTMAFGMCCSIWKADVKSAYKTVAYSLEGSEFCALVMKVKDTVLFANMTAMCFGGVSSVYGWHRIAFFLAHVARVKPKLIFGKFVDVFIRIVEAWSSGEPSGGLADLIWCLRLPVG